MRLFIAGVVICSTAVTVSSQQTAGRAMKIDDLIGAIRVTDPQLTPDGGHVAFVRTITDLKTGDRNADIWIVAADGSSEPRGLILAGKTDNTPRFSPDGRRLAFSQEKDLVVWDFQAPGITHRMAVDQLGQFGMCFLKDGQQLASGGCNGWIGLWDLTA